MKSLSDYHQCVVNDFIRSLTVNVAHIIDYLISTDLSDEEKRHLLQLDKCDDINHARKTREKEKDNVRLRALFIKGPTQPLTICYIIRRGGRYAEEGNFDSCLMMWKWALIKLEERISLSLLFTEDLLLLFARVFAIMTHLKVEISFNDVIMVFEKCMREKIKNKNLFICLIFLLTRLEPRLTPQQFFVMRKTVYQFVKLNPQLLPLHLCLKENSNSLSKIYIFHDVKVIKLLLEVGANPHAVDVRGNTPLHILATNNACVNLQDYITLFVEAGAHLDTLNKLGQSLISIRGLNPLHYTSLQCLAATTVKKHFCNIYKNVLHPRLVQFVNLH